MLICFCVCCIFFSLHDIAALGSVLPECRGGFEGCGVGVDWQQGLMGDALEGAARGASFQPGGGASDGRESGDVKDVSHTVYAHT